MTRNTSPLSPSEPYENTNKNHKCDLPFIKKEEIVETKTISSCTFFKNKPLKELERKQRKKRAEEKKKPQFDPPKKI